MRFPGHCIAGVLLALTLAQGIAPADAQGSRPISMRDAQRWQDLQGQTDAALAKGDYPQAEALAKQAVTAGTAGFGGNDPNVAASWSSLGSAQLRNNNLTEAENAFRQARDIYQRRLGADHEYTGAMMNNLGLVLERQGKFSDAEILMREALAVKEKKQGRDHPDTAVTLANLARILDRQGKSGQLNQSAQAVPTRPATTAGGAGAAGAAPTSTPGSAAPAPGSAEALRLASQALSAAALGDFSQAESLHRQALAVHERSLPLDHPTTLATLTNLGSVMMLQGKFKEAEAVFRRVMTAREKVLGPEHPDTAISLNNVANALFEQAKQDDQSGPPARRARGGGRDFAQASETETLYRRALAVQEKTLGESHPSTAATLNNLAVLLAGRGRYAEAEPMHLRALSIAEKSLGPAHLDTASMMTTLAITYDRQGKSAQAEEAYAKAVATARQARVPRNLLINASSMAYSMARRGRIRDALPYYREAVDALEALYSQSQGQSEESRQAFLGQFAYVYRELIRILVSLNLQTAGQGYDREALAVASRSQSRVFSEMLRQADVARFSDAPAFAALKKRREGAQERITALRFALLSVADGQAGAAGQRTQIALQLAGQEAALKSAEDELWRDYPRFMELTNPRAVTVDELQKNLLREGEVLVSYALLPNDAIIFAVTRDKFQMAVTRVSRDELTRRVQRLRRPMERIAGGEPLIVLREMDPQVLAGLYRDLLQPVAATLQGAKRVMVVADGPLYTLPFELMVTRFGNDERAKFDILRAAGNGSADKPFFAEYGALPFAGQAHQFSYLPSLAALASQRTNPKPPPRYSKQLVAFADAIFGGEDGAPVAYNPQTRTLLGVLAATLPTGGARIPRLAETAAEAREVAAILGGETTVLMRGEAQEKRAKSGLLKDTRYVLFATHGFLGTDFLQNIDLSLDAEGTLSRSNTPSKGALAQPALAMTLTGDLQGEDGLLSMKEVIEDLELSAELVVLSACNTAGDSQSSSNGEGFAGLTRSFMYAGAKSLVVSHWSVDSVATQALVTGIFRELKGGKTPADALGAAQKSLVSTIYQSEGRSFSRAHPFFWAPFVVVGD